MAWTCHACETWISTFLYSARARLFQIPVCGHLRCSTDSKGKKTGLSCYRKNMLKHTFLYDLGMARLVVTFPDRFFLVDGEKHVKRIDICIYFRPHFRPQIPKIEKNDIHFWGFRTPGGSTANIGLAFGVTFKFDLQAEFVMWHLYIRQRQFSKLPAKLNNRL